MEIFAHRGNSGEAPENTLAAFRQVAGVGADGVEFDVQLSRDGVPVVIHDETVDRTTDGKGAVAGLTLAQLQVLDAGKWFGAAFAGERIPTLEAVLEVFRGSSIRVNIELKTNRMPYPGLSQKVIDLVRKFGMERQVVVSSFNHLTLEEVRSLAPDLEYAALTGDQLLEPWEYVQHHGFRAFHPISFAVNADLVRHCHALGLKVRVWTVDDPARGAEIAAMGTDGIFTNHPRRFVKRGA